MLEFFKKKTRIRFMATRKWWYTLSAIMMGLSALGLWKPGLNYGLDYTGGISVELYFQQPPAADQVRDAIHAAGFPDAQVNVYGSLRELIVRLEPRNDMTATQVGDRIRETLQADGLEVEVRRVDFVGPQVGAELREKGYLAMLFTFLGILIYIAWRFEKKMAVGAILAALHTPIVILGFFAYTQMTFDLTVLAAMLAVVGYQINDTVVVFDRARERFPLMRGAAPAEVLDAAINETLSRTVITSVATMIVVAAMLVLGGETLRGFSAAILIGVVVGTYSSIYIASASALDLKLTAKDLMATRGERRPVDDMP